MGVVLFKDLKPKLLLLLKIIDQLPCLGAYLVQVVEVPLDLQRDPRAVNANRHLNFLHAAFQKEFVLLLCKLFVKLIQVQGEEEGEQYFVFAEEGPLDVFVNRVKEVVENEFQPFRGVSRFLTLPNAQ